MCRKYMNTANLIKSLFFLFLLVVHTNMQEKSLVFKHFEYSCEKNRVVRFINWWKEKADGCLHREIGKYGYSPITYVTCCHYFLKMSIFIILYCVKVNVLSTVIGIQERRPSMDMTEFEFVVPEVVQQLNP